MSQNLKHKLINVCNVDWTNKGFQRGAEYDFDFIEVKKSKVI